MGGGDCPYMGARLILLYIVVCTIALVIEKTQLES